MRCPKCDYQRQPSDDVPDWQCPSCGVVYAKIRDNVIDNNYVASKEARHDTTIKPGFNFKKLRVTVLLVILVAVALDSWLTSVRSTDWNNSLWVVVYSINTDGSQQIDDYINSIDSSEFNSIQNFFTEETKRYGINIKDPIEVRLGPAIKELPPLPPEDRSLLKTVWWSLQLRYWAAAVDTYDGPRPNIRVFVLYHRPENNKRLQHSTGLQKGMVSVVHAFADNTMSEMNNVVITHEILHTLGATDKYSLQTTLPIYPDGYAEPELDPLFPQQFTEIMGGRMPLSETEAEMPSSLSEVLVGDKTALEIGWHNPE